MGNLGMRFRGRVYGIKLQKLCR